MSDGHIGVSDGHIGITRIPRPSADQCCLSCLGTDEGYYQLEFGNPVNRVAVLLCGECMVGLADMLTPGKYGLSLREARKRLREKAAR